MAGNIDVDPLFRNPATGDYRLSAYSECIDSGTETFIYDDDTLLYNEDFYFDGVDLGYYEFPGPTAFELGLPHDSSTVDSDEILFYWQRSNMVDYSPVHYYLRLFSDFLDTTLDVGYFNMFLFEVDQILTNNQSYCWEVTATNDIDTTYCDSPSCFELSILSTDQMINIPNEYKLIGNYPNPFNPITTIQYELPRRSDVQITIYNLPGREVTTLVSETQDAGFKSVQWNATNVPSGMYFYQIRASDFVQTKKMILLK